jgi:hypothetical protein
MLTPSVNVVQSSFPERLQGEISGLSRSVSNLGSSFGTPIAGTILVSVIELGTALTRWRCLCWPGSGCWACWPRSGCQPVPGRLHHHDAVAMALDYGPIVGQL